MVATATSESHASQVESQLSAARRFLSSEPTAEVTAPGPVTWESDPVTGRKVFASLVYVPRPGTAAHARWEWEQEAERSSAALIATCWVPSDG